MEVTPASGQQTGRRVALVALLALLGVAFTALSVWQLARRTEKLALIAAVEQRAHATPVDAPGPGQWPAINARHDAYRAVKVTGLFLKGGDTLVQAVSDFGPGYWVITPLRTGPGWIVLVNRGFTAADRRTNYGAAPSDAVTVTGLLRVTEPHGGFLHANDPAQDRWYSRDVATIGKARRLSQVAPYFIDAGTNPDPAQPIGGLTVIDFPNNHLNYALTWLALAILSAIGAVRALRRS